MKAILGLEYDMRFVRIHKSFEHYFSLYLENYYDTGLKLAR